MEKIMVQVTPEFALDAGTVFEDKDSVTINAPELPLFDQLCAWLVERPSVDRAGGQPKLSQVYIGATAIFMRWGTWLAALLDRNKPLDPRVDEYSMISDSEMRRIQIEATWNLAQLIKLAHRDKSGFYKLCLSAHAHLPMSCEPVGASIKIKNVLTLLYSLPGILPQAEQVIAARRDVATDPYRVLANMLVNMAYRNTTHIESLHAGCVGAYTLTHRRIPESDEEIIMSTLSSQVYGAVKTSPWLSADWPDNLTFVRAMPFIYPYDWSLTDSSAEITLPREWMEQP